MDTTVNSVDRFDARTMPSQAKPSHELTRCAVSLPLVVATESETCVIVATKFQQQHDRL